MAGCAEPPANNSTKSTMNRALPQAKLRAGLLWAVLAFLLAAAGSSAAAAERAFDWGQFSGSQTLTGFVSTVTGEGGPGEWRVVFEETPPALAPLSPNAPKVTGKAVLAQVSENLADERFPLLIWQGDTFRDFKLTTGFKTVSGVVERMAGIAFRLQDQRNYYVVRASSLGNTFRFYKVVDGQRGPPHGVNIPIPSGTWHELSIECSGNQIRCSLNGEQVIPTLTDNSFSEGKIAFWTKSDSVTWFGDTRITYTPREVAGQKLVRQTLERYPRLLGLAIYLRDENADRTRVIASTDEAERGKEGGKNELDVLRNGSIYYGKGKGDVTVTMPLRDRNGDLLAAVKVRMDSFPGQTEQNAVVRATTIIKYLQAYVTSAQDLE